MGYSKTKSRKLQRSRKCEAITNKPLIIYHGDCNDGFGAALAAYLKLGKNADYVAGMYDGVVPNMKGREVMVFDYHFKAQLRLVIKHHALPFEIDGQKGWIINSGRLFASEIGNELAKIHNSLAIVWTFTDKKKISCSLLSVEGSSAQIIAEQFGGGGHKHA